MKPATAERIEKELLLAMYDVAAENPMTKNESEWRTQYSLQLQRVESLPAVRRCGGRELK